MKKIVISILSILMVFAMAFSLTACFDDSATPNDAPAQDSANNDNTTVGEQMAVASAKNYLRVSAFSKKGLIEQLEFEGYSIAEATYAVNNCGANWTEQAVKSAKNYLRVSAFSKKGLFEQLQFEGYLLDEATYAVNNCGADWKEQAVKSAKNYLNMMPFSKKELIAQLEFEGFTNEEATYGVEQAYV